MATIYSDQLTKVRAGRNLKPNEWQGKARVLHWDFASLPAGNVGDVLVCGRIRAGERLIWGFEVHSALTSGAAQATGSYGTYAMLADGSLGAVISATAYLGATSFEAAGATALADTIAKGALVEATVDVLLCCTNTTEAFATAGRVAGAVLLVGD